MKSKGQIGPLQNDIDQIHLSYGGFFHARISAEAGKIMGTGQKGCSLAHAVNIRCGFQGPHILPVEYRLESADVTGVAVGLPERIVAAVKTV